jgi:hypothetical protein
VRLPRLTLQAVLLLLVVGVAVLRLVAVADVLLEVLFAALDLHQVHVVQHLQAQLDVSEQQVTARLGEVLAHHDTQHLQVLGMRRHGVGWHHPAALAQLVGQGELVVVLVELLVQAEGDERQASAALLRHDDEFELLEGVGQVVGGAGEVGHDGAVAVLAQADQLVVLADDLGGTLGEVEGEGRLVGSEVVDVEDELLGEVFGGSPDDPANTGVDEAVPISISISSERAGGDRTCDQKC